jgi:hypothetical protein
VNPTALTELKRLARKAWQRKQHEAAKCIGKRGFDNRIDAQRAIRPRLKGMIDVYRCEFCSKYHVGSNRALRQVEKTARRRRV